MFLTLKFVIYMILDINRKIGKQQFRGKKLDGKRTCDSTDLSMVPTTMDNGVTETMSREVSHKAVALLDKCSDDQSLQLVRDYVAAVCIKAGVTVIMDAPEHERPWLAENPSNVYRSLMML